MLAMAGAMRLVGEDEEGLAVAAVALRRRRRVFRHWRWQGGRRVMIRRAWQRRRWRRGGKGGLVGVGSGNEGCGRG